MQACLGNASTLTPTAHAGNNTQALANANNSFLLTERRRHYLRYMGALAFFEINGPSGVVCKLCTWFQTPF